MVKRAVLVGCNYPCKAYGLVGSVNDAFAIAEQLEAKGFEKENVIILYDTMPGRRRDAQKDESLRPTRVNILSRLQAMIRKTEAGDTCFFSFSGYGMQVDMNSENSSEHGLDEAILPTDFQESLYGGHCVIECAELHDILAGAPRGSSVTMLMDCDHATTVADMCGTVSGKLVDGVTERVDFCGFKARGEKMKSSEHKREVWMDEPARLVKARPRFQPVATVCKPRQHFPTRSAMCRTDPIVFCISAAGHGQTALEMQVVTHEATWSAAEEKKPHGVLSWCFVQALKELRNTCDYLELTGAISRHMESMRRSFPKMDQEALLTFVLPRSDPHMRVLEPPPQAPAPPPSMDRQTSVRPVVPPPPPGYVKSVPGYTGAPPSGELRPPAKLKKQTASPPRKKHSCCNTALFASLGSAASPKKPSPTSDLDGPSLWESLLSWFTPLVPGETSASPLKPRASPKPPAPRPDEPAQAPQPQVSAPVPMTLPVPVPMPVPMPVPVPTWQSNRPVGYATPQMAMAQHHYQVVTRYA